MFVLIGLLFMFVLIGLFPISALPGLNVVGFIICMLFLAVIFVLARLRFGFASAAAASDPRRLASACCTVSYIRIPKYRKKGDDDDTIEYV